MKKKILTYTLCAMLLIQAFFSFSAQVYANETIFTAEGQEIPAVCRTPAEMMMLYQNFQKEMINRLLAGDLGEKTFSSTLNPVGLFSSEVLKLPTPDLILVDAVATQLRNSSRQILSATLTTAALLTLTSLSVVGDQIQGFAILFQDRVVVREWRTLLQIDSQHSQAAYQLSKIARITATLENVEPLEEIVRKYQEFGLFDVYNPNKSSMSYLNILFDLATMNGLMKSFVAVGNIDSLEEYQADHVFGLTFNATGLKKMQEDYGGRERFLSSCNQYWNTMWSNIKKGGAGIGKASNDSLTIIRDSLKRLADVSVGNAKSLTNKDYQYQFTDLELQQLATIYGVDVTKMTDEDAVNLGDLLALLTGNPKKSIIESGKKIASIFQKAKTATTSSRDIIVAATTGTVAAIGDGTKGVANYSKALRSLLKKPFDGKELTPAEKRDVASELGILYNTDYDQSLQQLYLASFERVRGLQEDTSLGFLMIDPTTQTQQFASLIYGVEEAQKKVGNKSKGLVQAIGKVCQKQCGNKGTAGCFAR